MALTPAEKQKRYRERQKQALKTAPDLTMNFVRGNLSDHVGDNYQFEGSLVAGGFQNLGYFGDERAEFDVDALVGSDASLSGKSSIERMEYLAGVFLEAASEVHRKINEFKLSEIDARIIEIEQADLSAPEAKAKALQDIVTLQGIKSRLEGKTFRRSFAEISVKGSFSE